MPGFLTHYVFGTKAIKNISDNYIKKSIRNNKAVYNLGLQGPDIFFYFIPYKLINKTNLGSLLHKNKIKDFFVTAINRIINCEDERKKEVMTAYICGFYGHYTLDRHCHPYIFYKSGYLYTDKNYHEKHVKLESDIDYIYIRDFYKKKNVEINYKKLVDLNNYQIKVVATLLNDICNKVFDNIWLDNNIAKAVLFNFKHLINFFNDSNGKKYKFINKIEKKITGSEKMSAVFNGNCYRINYTDPMNNSKGIWYNPWKKEDKYKYSFYELANFAEKELGEFIKIFDICIKGKNVDKLKNHIKNCSYITGLVID